jgi:hypothetical protein
VSVVFLGRPRGPLGVLTVSNFLGLPLGRFGKPPKLWPSSSIGRFLMLPFGRPRGLFSGDVSPACSWKLSLVGWRVDVRNVEGPNVNGVCKLPDFRVGVVIDPEQSLELFK